MNNAIKTFNNQYREYISKEFQQKDFPMELLEKYIIDECLSISESSEVYLVRDRITDYKYILKVTDSTTLKDELREEALIKALKHKDIPEFIEDYYHNEQHFLVKTYFEGVSLYDYVMEKGELRLEEVCGIIEQLSNILEYLHSQSPPIIHRDIKPQNIIYTYDKQVKLIDFDIARRFRQEESYDTVYMGTKNYAPPEQFGYSQTDHRTDIYSAGMLLFFLMTGHTKFQMIDKDIHDIRIKRLIKKCTAFSPKDRYANISQLAKSIHRINGLRSKVQKYLKYGALLLITVIGLAIFKSLIVAENTRAIATESEGASTYQHQITRISDEEFDKGSNETIDEAIEAIYFPDKSFEMVIREKIDKPTGDILISDVEKIANLAAEEKNISSIEGIQYFTSLEVLGLWENNIEDISPLESLVNLEQLFLDGNNVSDLNPLRNFKRLFNLGLGGNNIEDITILSYLTELRLLNISNNNISDLSPLSQLDHLESLDICGRNNITDYTPLKDMPRLIELEVYGEEDFDDFDVLE